MSVPPGHISQRYPVPERTLIQRQEALLRANEVRSSRAQLKKDLKAGRVSIYTILIRPEDFDVESMTVFDLLLATPKYGRVKTNKTLQLCRISPSKTIGGMTDRQRSELVTWLR